MPDSSQAGGNEVTTTLEGTRSAPAAVPDGEAIDTDYTPAVYGSLLVTTLIAIQWQSDSVTFVAFSVAVSILVFWLTHVWSGIVNRRLHGPIGGTDIAEIGGREAPMLAPAILPVVLLGAATILGSPVNRALDVALLASIAQLFVWGLAVGRAMHSSLLTAVIVAAVDCALGIAVVVLKVLVIH